MAKKPNRTMPRAWAGSEPPQRRAKGGGRGSRNRRRSRSVPWLRVGVVAVLVVVAALGSLLVLGHSDSKAELDGRVDREVSALLEGIPQTGNTLGSPMAPVTLQVFGDLECLTTKNWFLGQLPAIVRTFVRTGVMKIEYRSFKTDTIDPGTFVKQQTAAIAAGAQDKLWTFIETFYYEQGREYTPYATESYLDGIASQVQGLSLAQWHHDREGGRRSETVVADDSAARAFGFHDTPAFRLGRTGDTLKNFIGRKLVRFVGQKNPVSLIDVNDLEQAIRTLH